MSNDVRRILDEDLEPEVANIYTTARQFARAADTDVSPDRIEQLRGEWTNALCDLLTSYNVIRLKKGPEVRSAGRGDAP